MKWKFEFTPKKDFITPNGDEVTRNMVLIVELDYNHPFIYEPARRAVAKAYWEEHRIKKIESFLKKDFFNYKEV